MEQYLIDNNLISNFFSGNYTEKGMDFIAGVIDQTPIISIITEIEALSWINSKEDIIKSFVQDANVLTITSSVVAECVNIRRTKKIKTPDAIIASIAIVNNLILISSDNDFKNIEGLRLIDPSQF
jgi:predicted nucleic acid-binding protein